VTGGDRIISHARYRDRTRVGHHSLTTNSLPRFTEGASKAEGESNRRHRAPK
jgi:hypothetical protein